MVSIIHENEAGGSNMGLTQMLDQAYLEVIPTKSVVQQLGHVPSHSWVGISCSPAAGVGLTLDIVDRLYERRHEHPLKLSPHITARVIRDRGQLREVLSRLEAAEVKSVFVAGGDSPRPVGDYSCALDLLRDMADIGHGFEDIGIAAYPEGHPLLDNAELLQILLEKQPYSTYLVTQMCFDPGVIIRWLRLIRAAGVHLPAWLGLPGVVDIPKLTVLSFRIGVGQSIRVLRKQKGLVRNLISNHEYRPDDLLAGLQAELADEKLGIPGFHLFSFNNVEATSQWRTDTVKKRKVTEQ